jgi:hypothetical protein
MSVVNHVIEDKSAADHRRKINEAATTLKVILFADDTAIINPESHANPLKNYQIMLYSHEQMFQSLKPTLNCDKTDLNLVIYRSVTCT